MSQLRHTVTLSSRSHAGLNQLGMMAIVALVVIGASKVMWAGAPIALHPENSHYFLWRGQPTLLITSGEHYGAILNRDFDYETYLRTIQSHGFNLTRIFSGVYCEAPTSFNIRNNTLSPAEGRLVCPWARSDQRGYARGGNKFDLSRWDDAYFERLRDFISHASRLGIVVEVVMFCPMYGEPEWRVSPLHPRNNINSVGDIPQSEVFALSHPQLVSIQESMVRKIVMELNEFDNVYFEICNEPYERAGQTKEWQARIAEVVVQTEKSLPKKHLIAQNLPNPGLDREPPQPVPNVSVLNFHGTKGIPDFVPIYYDRNVPIAADETGGQMLPSPYRICGWELLIAGGAVYDHLDFSFTVGHEDGSDVIDAPGGGGAELRKQLEILVRFINELDFVKMKPDKSVIRGGIPDGATARALVDYGKTYAIYVRGGNRAELVLWLPEAEYVAEWIDTKSGRVVGRESFRHEGGQRTVRSPEYSDDIALRVRRS